MLTGTPLETCCGSLNKLRLTTCLAVTEVGKQHRIHAQNRNRLGDKPEMTQSLQTFIILELQFSFCRCLFYKLLPKLLCCPSDFRLDATLACRISRFCRRPFLSSNHAARHRSSTFISALSRFAEVCILASAFFTEIQFSFGSKLLAKFAKHLFHSKTNDFK